MQRLDLPPDFSQVIKDLQRRIDTLERAPKANTPGTLNQIPMLAVADIYEVVTSGTFAPIYEGRFGGPLTHDCFGIAGNIVTDVGTTAEYRLRVYSSQATVGYVNTDLFTAATAISSDFTHLVDMAAYWTVGVGSTLLFQVEARRASGAGNVYVYAPNYLYLASRESFSGNVPTPIDDLL